MDGYQQFQQIMAEINAKKERYDKGNSNVISDDEVLKKLKDLFGI